VDEASVDMAVELAMSRVELAASQAAYLTQALVIIDHAASALAALEGPLGADQPGWRPAPRLAQDAWTDVGGLMAAAQLTGADASRLCRATVDILTVALNASRRMRDALRDDAVQAVQDA
jgi:hypothetical protein